MAAEAHDHARTQGHLLDVVVGAPAEGDVQLLEIRRYAGAVEVIYLVADEEDDDDFPALTDDVGTEYRPVGGTGSDRAWSADFVPGVPAQARRLTVAVGGERFEVALT